MSKFDLPSGRIKVIFLPEKKEVEVSRGISVLEAAILAGLSVEGDCGGKGICGKCKVRMVKWEGVSNTPAERGHISEESLTAGVALACQRNLTSDSVIWVDSRSNNIYRKGDSSDNYEILPLDPTVNKKYLVMSEPSLTDQISDQERLMQALSSQNAIEIRRSLLEEMPSILRQCRYKVTAVLHGNRLIALEKGDTRERKYGIAIDIGTTTVAGFLVDLNSGGVIASGTTSNYQEAFGSDVVSRIGYAIEHEGGRLHLRKKIIASVNEIIANLLTTSGISRDNVYEAVIVGNTTMTHLFLGLDCSFIAKSPFIPVFRSGLYLHNREVGLEICSSGGIYVLPNVSGFVGSDTVGVMLATHIDSRPGVSLAVDIGTNGEIVLAGKGRILACSTAAGPAFEGARIRYGMRALDGAIKGVHINEDVYLDIIGGGRPLGICGSGLVDAVAEMLRVGIVDSGGRIADREAVSQCLSQKILDRIRETKQGRELVLASHDSKLNDYNIAISQQDIRELQLANGAIRAGIQILLAVLGITVDEVDRMFLAGAFGNYFDKHNALAIGLIPEALADRVYQVGNAAGEGSRMALASLVERKRADKLAQMVEHIELSTREDFQEKFIAATYFPART